jgi:8-oxo-dGTP pyrophosphatase MutT (NUDIX family)
MMNEKSCGAVVFTVINNEIRYLLIKSRSGIYGFPKGHVEGREGEQETALREIFEETGVRVKLLPDFRAEDEYVLPKKHGARKLVVYFLGYYEGQSIKYSADELSDAFLIGYDGALSLLQFEGGKRVLRAANDFLMKNHHICRG